MAFHSKSREKHSTYGSPEELYLRGALKRTKNAVDSLWLQQGDVIRTYTQYQETPDLAIELPTGTGKTLPALLIAEWVRRKNKGPVLYATPTKQLAEQVYATAIEEGIPAVLLIGPSQNWNTIDEASVEKIEAIGITTYSAIFNSNPKVPEAQLIIFDDAQAGEQFVGNKYSITISRRDEEESYKKVLDALTPFITELLKQRLEGEPDPGVRSQVRMILPAAIPSAMTNLDAVLAQLPNQHQYEFAMIRSGLQSCCVYIAYDGIQIRPMIPPTFENKIFKNAGQRIYLSATLGAGGELERAFGCEDIIRMPLPEKTLPRSGRRLFVFPDLVRGVDPICFTRRILELTDKALILSQDTIEGTEVMAKQLAGKGVPVLGRTDLERTGLKTFAKSRTGILSLTNRYDGLDLPGDACHIVVLSKTPSAVGLQERFLSERTGSTAVISERIRTRIIQGTGRCTRGPSDYAVVVILGDDITRYFSRPDNRRPLEQELQAEIEFGWDNSKEMPEDEILDNIHVFLQHGDTWHQSGEPLLEEYRNDVEKKPSPMAAVLGQVAPLEVSAWKSAFSGNWIEASNKLQEAANEISSNELRGYRGLLLYLAGVWLFQGANGESEVEKSSARELIRRAGKAAGTHGAWLQEMCPLAGESKMMSTQDTIAVNAIATRLRRSRVTRIKEKLQTMGTKLAQQESSPYEQGLTLLGEFLGAVANKPKAQGRCDSAWKWDNALWITLEAKSEEHPNGLLPLKDIRQTNTQLDLLASDNQMSNAPSGSVSIILTNRLTVDPEHAQAAQPHVYLASLTKVEEIAADVQAAWRNLLSVSTSNASDSALRSHIQSVFSENGCLPSQIIEQLTQNRIRPED